MIKLVDVPEMNYFAAENVGEVCCKGINVFKGYFKDEEKTREAIDEDGWLHSGDIGRWTKVGGFCSRGLIHATVLKGKIYFPTTDHLVNVCLRVLSDTSISLLVCLSVQQILQ